MLIYHPPQLIIEETESLLEKWKHPDPYRAPTAPGGSKWERNLPVPSTERELSITRIPHSHELDLLTCIPQRHHTCTCKLEQHSMGMSWRFLLVIRNVQICLLDCLLAGRGRDAAYIKNSKEIASSTAAFMYNCNLSGELESGLSLHKPMSQDPSSMHAMK